MNDNLCEKVELFPSHKRIVRNLQFIIYETRYFREYFQFQDLVKSHLMYAVRQDVNVLKLKISELLVKISQLESENLYLRAKASPEVLKLLERRNQTS